MSWRRVVAVLFLFFSSLPSVLAKNENEGESELFCQIRLLSENDPEKLVFGNEEREKQIMRQIEKVGPEIRSLSGKTDQRDATLIAKFHAIAHEANQLMENVKDLRRKAAEKRLSAKRHLHQVIFGEYGGEAEDTGELGASPETIQKIFNHEKFEESCGGSGGKVTGKSLINDFICLCVSRIDITKEFKSDNDQSICKSGVDTAVESNFKNWTAVWHWNNHRICVNTPPLTPTPPNIHKLVALFERAVEREQDKSQVQGIFGYVNNDNKEKVCNASKAGFTCVNYNYTLKNGGIEWVNHLKNASQDLQDMARYAEESESTLPQLELLEYNALLLYEEAKYSAHLPHATPSNETIANSSNESYQGDLTNSSDTSEEEKLEEEEDVEGNKDATWKGGPPWELSGGKDTMAEKKTEAREYIDVSEESTQSSQPSQPVQGQGAPGSPPHYILISSTETSQPSPKKTDEGKGGGREEPEVTVLSSESTTQEAASPSQGPSQATSQPPTQPPKRLREEKKAGE